MPYRFAIADDEPLSVQLLSDYLSRLNEVTLVKATDDLNEIEALIDDGAVDIVLLDFNIKGAKDGHIAQILKKRCRFIIITAYPLAYIEDMIQKEVHGFLSKPASFSNLRLEIRKVLGKAL
jgi:DNA-binding NarL/FixJ family response regulator